jgi:type I restriction enzyme S subunit
MAPLAERAEPAGEAWPTRPLDDLTESFDHKRKPVKEADRRHGPYAYYGASGIVDRVDSYLFDGEYLLVAEDGENLRTLQTPIAFLATGKFWVNNHAHVLRGNADNDTRFLMYALRATDVSGYLTGSTMPKLTKGSLGRVHVPAPRLAEQRAIAHILGTLDDKIELNRRTNETLEAMARAMFKSWFVDFDPVRAKVAGKQPAGMDAATAALFPSEFVESEWGEIPKGWAATTLGKAVARRDGTIQTGPFGSQLHASDYLPSGVPVVMPKDISGRRVSTNTIARVSEQDAERLSRHRLQPGDVVYSRRGDVERHALISEREAGWLCGTGCLLVRLGPNWPSPMFASFALDRPETRAWITQHAIGATMPNLNTGILSAVPIVMPPEQVLRAFGLAVDQVQGLVVARDAESGMLAQARDALLPRLLSGELRIPDAERNVSAAT